MGTIMITSKRKYHNIYSFSVKTNVSVCKNLTLCYVNASWNIQKEWTCLYYKELKVSDSYSEEGTVGFRKYKIKVIHIKNSQHFIFPFFTTAFLLFTKHKNQPKLYHGKLEWIHRKVQNQKLHHSWCNMVSYKAFYKRKVCFIMIYDNIENAATKVHSLKTLTNNIIVQKDCLYLVDTQIYSC